MNARKAMLKAVEKLVQQKSLDALTVQDILDEAEVSRSTFYKYFKDKYDLANAYYENYVTNEVLSKFNGHNWYELMMMITDFVKANKEYFRKVISNRDNDMFAKFLFEYGYHFYSSVCRKNRHCTQISQTDDLAIRFISSGGVYMIEEWVIDRCAVSQEEIVKCIVDLTPDVYKEYLE